MKTIGSTSSKGEGGNGNNNYYFASYGGQDVKPRDGAPSGGAN